MIRFGAISLTLCVLAALIIPAQAATSRMPYGSFLTRPVSDANDFARLLRQDRVVAQRFADHFGMNNDALADYVERYGEVRSISRSGQYLEFFIDKRGQVHRHYKRLGAKHRILFVRGTPLLDMECGNPMSRAVPKVPEQPRPGPQVTQAPPPVQPPLFQPTPEAPAPPGPAVVEEPRGAPAPPPAPAPAPPPVEVVPPPSPVAPTPAQAPPVTRPNPSWLIPILIGGGVLINEGGDGGPSPPPPPGPVIPESSTLALGASGMGFLVTFYRMRRGR